MLSKKTARIRKEAKLSLLDRAALALLFFFLLSDVMGGAFRYFSVRFHVAWLPYLPHLLLAFALVPLFLAYVLSEGITSAYLVIFFLFGVSAAYGTVNLGNAKQVAFGLWVLTAFLFGVVILPSLVRGWRKLTPFALSLWALAVTGVLLNVLYQWPWIGLEYQVGATSVVASRLWSVAGLNIARLPGFGRASFSTALEVLFLALFLRETLPRRWRVLMWILSGAAIALTTSKAPIAIYLLLSAMWVFYHGSIRRSWRLIPASLAAIDTLLPLSLWIFRVNSLRPRNSPIETMLAGSFVGRMEVGWPDWIHMILMHGSPLFGRGLGGIGQAQWYFERSRFSPGDSIAVYLYGTFGILGLVLLIVYGWKASHMVVNGGVSRFLFFCACVVLLEGVTANVLEGTFMAMAFGATLRYLQDKAPRLATYGLAPGSRMIAHAGMPGRSTAKELQESIHPTGIGD